MWWSAPFSAIEKPIPERYAFSDDPDDDFVTVPGLREEVQDLKRERKKMQQERDAVLKELEQTRAQAAAASLPQQAVAVLCFAAIRFFGAHPAVTMLRSQC